MVIVELNESLLFFPPAPEGQSAAIFPASTVVLRRTEGRSKVSEGVHYQIRF